MLYPLERGLLDQGAAVCPIKEREMEGHMKYKKCSTEKIDLQS